MEHPAEFVPYEQSIEYAHEVDSIVYDHLHECPDIHAHNMMHVFMVTMGMRPGTVIHLSPVEKCPGGEDRRLIDLTLLDDMCMMLDLKKDVVQKPDGYTFISISKDEKIATEISTDFNLPNNQNPKVEAELERKKGLLLGFPETAVDAWVSKDLINENELPEETRNSLEYAFVDFRFSRNNWKEEFEFVKERAYKLEKLAPKIFESVISAHAEMMV